MKIFKNFMVYIKKFKNGGGGPWLAYAPAMSKMQMCKAT